MSERAAITAQELEPRQIVERLSGEEKICLVSGQGMWRTHPLPQYGIPAIVMTDGAYGVRYSVDQIESGDSGGTDLREFLGLVNQRARDMDAAFGASRPATCFPNGSCFACSWDVALAHELGTALALECHSLGIHLLLGPAINIRRTPLGGRGYEYYSEDPVLSGDLATGVINGLQQHGVGAALKHFACNNSEIERTTMDSLVDERSLREVYLLGFERAIRKSDPWAVMSSYNVLNHVQVAHNRWLLTEVLRDEWGYAGVVISDWHGIKDRAASIIAGNDLDMPQSEARKRQLRAALASQTVPVELVNRSCERVLELVAKAKAKRGVRRDLVCDLDEHHVLARRMAAESIVLLRNRDRILPLDPNAGLHIAVVGTGAVKPVIQGSGSASTRATQVDVPLDEIRRRAGPGSRIEYYPGYDEDPGQWQRLLAEAIQGARGADVIVVFVNTEGREDGEGADRRDLALAGGHDALIHELARVAPNVVVVLANPDAVVMPWIDEVKGVLETFFAGQAMGGAVADILFGRANPCGKLTVTFPKRIEDTPAFLSYPGENGEHRYAEGIYVGYRYYDSKLIEPLFPFGFGLSYTTFEYTDLRLGRDVVHDSESLRVEFTVTNTGPLTGKETYQLYLQRASSRVHHAVRELKGFGKVELAPGEARTVTLELQPRDLQYFDSGHGKWQLEEGELVVAIGASSRDIRLACTVSSQPARRPRRRLTLDTQPKFVLDDPVAKGAFAEFLQRRLEVDAAAAASMLEYCRTSFFGILTTLNYFFRLDLSEQEVADLLASINEQD